MLVSDPTILTETPPLRARWTRVGQQAAVPITGNRARQLVLGALNVATSTECLDRAGQWNQQSFRENLRHIRSRWRGWNLVLVVDRGNPDTARRSCEIAAELRIELRWQPTTCPELNPVEGKWRLLKGRMLSNEPTPDLDVSLDRAFTHVEEMSGIARLKAAAVLSGNLWLRTQASGPCADQGAGPDDLDRARDGRDAGHLRRVRS